MRLHVLGIAAMLNRFSSILLWHCNSLLSFSLERFAIPGFHGPVAFRVRLLLVFPEAFLPALFLYRALFSVWYVSVCMAVFPDHCLHAPPLTLFYTGASNLSSQSVSLSASPPISLSIAVCPPVCNCLSQQRICLLIPTKWQFRNQSAFRFHIQLLGSGLIVQEERGNNASRWNGSLGVMSSPSPCFALLWWAHC